LPFGFRVSGVSTIIVLLRIRAGRSLAFWIHNDLFFVMPSALCIGQSGNRRGRPKCRRLEWAGDPRCPRQRRFELSSVTTESLTKAKAVKDSSLPILGVALPLCSSFRSRSSSYRGSLPSRPELQLTTPHGSRR
jgi:hypothetical protein